MYYQITNENGMNELYGSSEFMENTIKTKDTINLHLRNGQKYLNVKVVDILPTSINIKNSITFNITNIPVDAIVLARKN